VHCSLAQNGGELQRVVGVKRPPALWLFLARIRALLHTVAVAGGQQQYESDDCDNAHWLPFSSTTMKSLRFNADGRLTLSAKAGREGLASYCF